MKRVVLTSLATWLVSSGILAPSVTLAEPVKKVNCVYPGERLASALSDFATQLGYAFEPIEYEDTLVWSHAVSVHRMGSACNLDGRVGIVGQRG